MEIEDLIQKCKDKSVTSEAVKGFEERMKEREAKFLEEYRETRPDSDWYNKRYMVSK